jgi:hypothetical protein
VNGPEIPMVVEQSADITLDQSADRFLGRNGVA